MIPARPRLPQKTALQRPNGSASRADTQKRANALKPPKKPLSLRAESAPRFGVAPDIVMTRVVKAALAADGSIATLPLADLVVAIQVLYRRNEDQARFIEGARKQAEKKDVRQGSLLLPLAPVRPRLSKK